MAAGWFARARPGAPPCERGSAAPGRLRGCGGLCSSSCVASARGGGGDPRLRPFSPFRSPLAWFVSCPRRGSRVRESAGGVKGRWRGVRGRFRRVSGCEHGFFGSERSCGHVRVVCSGSQVLGDFGQERGWLGGALPCAVSGDGWHAQVQLGPGACHAYIREPAFLFHGASVVVGGGECAAVRQVLGVEASVPRCGSASKPPMTTVSNSSPLAP